MIASSVVAAYECEGQLDDADLLLNGIRQTAAAMGLHEHGTAHAQYVPHGVTAVVFLAESHLLASTWPEFAFAYVEIALCGSQVSSGDLWRELSLLLCPSREEIHELRIPVMGVVSGPPSATTRRTQPSI